MGKFVSVINEQGYPLHIDLLCTFELKNDEYALFEYEGEDKRRISRISYDVWNGNVLIKTSAVPTCTFLKESIINYRKEEKVKRKSDEKLRAYADFRAWEHLLPYCSSFCSPFW